MKRLALVIVLGLCAAAEPARPLPAVPSTPSAPSAISGTNATGFTPPVTESGRDPFSPVLVPKESVMVSPTYKPNYFKEQNITLPTTARRINKITVGYQNIDGSMAEKSVILDGDIDWHFPLRLVQDIQDFKAKEVIRRPDPTPGVERFEPYTEFVFKFTSKKLFLQTPFLIRQDIPLGSPPKIVLDFVKDPYGSFYDKSFQTALPYFKFVDIKTHEDFYRVTLTLDGKYQYQISPEKDGFWVLLQ
ncbi:MAG: AMIN domain-containing protein [Helicobacter sp.]|nr:AMIN domain-containing protein [Helicobacter sp.]